MLDSTSKSAHIISYFFCIASPISTNEQITNDSQWAAVIKPSLETCDEVTCVGHSLGGALCNTFTMCANTGAEYLVGNTNAEMQEDYDSLVWTKKLILAKGSVEQGANTDMVE